MADQVEDAARRGEERNYTIRLYYFNDDTKPASLNSSGWVAAISNANLEIHRFSRCWSQRRARNKARRWVKRRALETTKVTIVEMLEGS